MPPKKKKTQLKKVERGYATTSIPKRVSLPEPPSEVPAEPNPEQPNSNMGDEKKSTHPEHDESTVALQRMVDKYQEKTEKDILRSLKTIDYDRRMGKGLPQVDIDEDLINEVIKLIDEEESQRGSPRLSGISREKLTGQIGVTYGVLRRLGFSEEIIMRCLREASGFELEQVFDWLYVHCPDNELDLAKISSDGADTTPPTPKTPEMSSRSSTPMRPNKKLLPPSSSLSTKSGKAKAAISGRKSEDNPNVHSPAPDLTGSEDASDIEDPNVEYVRLKLRITDLTGHRRRNNDAANDEFLSKLQARLENVKKSYFFREKDAEATFREKRREADQTALLSRLRGDTKESPILVKKQAEPIEAPKEDRPSDNVFDVSSDEETPLGGMFELLEPMPSSETTDTGKTITVKDMTLPKQWAGRTPKLLLQEFVSRSDRYAAIAYGDVSGSSRVKRASVRIRWSNEGGSEWTMEDIACHDLVQAE